MYVAKSPVTLKWIWGNFKARGGIFEYQLLKKKKYSVEPTIIIFIMTQKRVWLGVTGSQFPTNIIYSSVYACKHPYKNTPFFFCLIQEYSLEIDSLWMRIYVHRYICIALLSTSWPIELGTSIITFSYILSIMHDVTERTAQVLCITRSQ